MSFGHLFSLKPSPDLALWLSGFDAEGVWTVPDLRQFEESLGVTGSRKRAKSVSAREPGAPPGKKRFLSEL